MSDNKTNNYYSGLLPLLCEALEISIHNLGASSPATTFINSVNSIALGFTDGLIEGKNVQDSLVTSLCDLQATLIAGAQFGIAGVACLALEKASIKVGANVMQEIWDAGLGKAYDEALGRGEDWFELPNVDPFLDSFERFMMGFASVADEIEQGLADAFATIAEGLANSWSPIINGLGQLFGLAAATNFVTPPPPRRVDPLVLDLDNNGIQTTALAQSTAYFDLDKDGFREKVEWFSSGDGILAIDRNGNGQIDDIDELFGDNTAAHPNGFSRLAAYDTNADGLIDANDAEFGELRVWRDLNGNGLSEDGELSTLADAGVASISLNATGNTSTFTFADGSTGAVQDRFLEVDQMRAVAGGAYNLTLDALYLPWLRGSGQVRDLPLAVSSDDTLNGIVQDMAASTSLTL